MAKHPANFEISDSEENDDIYTLNLTNQNRNQVHHTPVMQTTKAAETDNYYNYYPQNMTKRTNLNHSLAMPPHNDNHTFSTPYQQNMKHHQRDISNPKPRDVK
jgi:hypothetical protein